MAQTILSFGGMLLASLLAPSLLLIGAILAHRHTPSLNTKLMIAGDILQLISAIASSTIIVILTRTLSVSNYGFIISILNIVGTVGGLLFGIGLILFVQELRPKAR